MGNLVRNTDNRNTVPYSIGSTEHSDDDVGLHVLGCQVDILGTNCTKNTQNVSNCGYSTVDNKQGFQFICGLKNK